MSTVKVASP